MDQRVPDSQVERERGSLLQRSQAGGLQRGEGEPESGDGHGERVQVHAVDRVQGLLDTGLGFHVGCVPVPAVQQSGERAKQEVP